VPTSYIANSADSHVLEPEDVWRRNVPSKLRDRAMRTERKSENLEVIYLDNKIIRRQPPSFAEMQRPPGAYDVTERIKDLEEQGVWHEVVYPSGGLWVALAEDPELEQALCRVYNEWLLGSFLAASSRFIGVAMVPVRDRALAVAEARWAKEQGYKAIMLACTPPGDARYNSEEYEPLWSEAEEMGLRICFHVGTGMDPIVESGSGGAVINYLETFIPAQRGLSYLVASGVLDRHPDLHFLFVEGGASWLAGVIERLDEGYRQHNIWARPKLSVSPGELVRRQVHVTFQHDRAALFTTEISGLGSVMWGSDYPHLEGTFPNTRRAVEDVFAGVPDDVRAAATFGNLARVFDVPPPPAA
jgi:predicted TIM-barrel fold metal-dependent hydrolase